MTPHYLCVLTRPGRLDDLTVHVEAAGDLTSYETAAAGLAGRIKDRIGITATVEVRPPHALERSLGKARRIQDLR